MLFEQAVDQPFAVIPSPSEIDTLDAASSRGRFYSIKPSDLSMIRLQPWTCQWIASDRGLTKLAKS
jgi:hypothetical protein